MNIAFLIGRIIFSAFWLMSASNHFTKLNDMSQYTKAKGVPFPKLAVAGSGVLLLLGGASVLLGVYPTIGVILLIVFMLGATFQMHNFWTVTDRQMKQADRINFLKNMAIIGALLMLLAIPQPWLFSLASR
jgi:putative oxidoreductase